MSPKRWDGTLVPNISKFMEFTFLFMPKRSVSNFLHNMKLDLSETHEFLEQVNKGRDEQSQITLFEITIASLARTLVVRPKANRFIGGGRLWQRNISPFRL